MVFTCDGFYSRSAASSLPLENIVNPIDIWKIIALKFEAIFSLGRQSELVLPTGVKWKKKLTDGMIEILNINWIHYI